MQTGPRGAASGKVRKGPKGSFQDPPSLLNVLKRRRLKRGVVKFERELTRSVPTQTRGALRAAPALALGAAFGRAARSGSLRMRASELCVFD